MFWVEAGDILIHVSFGIISLPPLMYIRKRDKENRNNSFKIGKILCQPANTTKTVKKETYGKGSTEEIPTADSTGLSTFGSTTGAGLVYLEA